VNVRWTWPRLGLAPSLGLLGALVSEGILKGTLGIPEQPRHLALVVISLSGWLGAWLSYPVAKVAVANAPDPARGWARFLGYHLASYVIAAGVSLSASRALYAALEAALGVSSSTSWSTDYLSGVHLHTTFYAALVAGLTASVLGEQRARAALSAVELEAALSTSRIGAVTDLVDPELLVATLRVVRREVPTDVARAEWLVQRLADLLRDALSTTEPTWTLGREREHLAAFLDVLGAKHDARIALVWSVRAELSSAVLPRFALREAIGAVVADEAGAETVTIAVLDEDHVSVRGRVAARAVAIDRRCAA
jgi:hypothetical protein